MIDCSIVIPKATLAIIHTGMNRSYLGYHFLFIRGTPWINTQDMVPRNMMFYSEVVTVQLMAIYWLIEQQIID